MKKIFAILLIVAFALQGTAFAAVGGAKSSRPATTSKPAVTRETPPPLNKSTTEKQSEYKPSAPASSYQEQAPAAKSATGQTNTATTNSNTGGFLRNAGLFGGGMLLGGLLGNMFGYSSPMLSSIGDLLSMVLIGGALFLGGRYLMNKVRNNKTTNRY